MDVIEQVGAFLGLVAFLGLAVLVLLYFQQARDVRRLREWAGRAPERAQAAAEEAAVAAAREAGVGDDRSEGERGGSLRERLAARLPPGAGRRPETRYLALIAAGAALVAVGVVTGAFGLVGGDDDGRGAGGGDGGSPIRPGQIEVAVLNGTATGTSAGVPGLAEDVAKRVKRAGFKVGEVADAGSYVDTLIMFSPGHRPQAERVASDLDRPLGDPEVARMSGDIRSAAGGADVAVVIGQDNSQL